MTDIVGVKIPLNPWVLLPMIVVAATIFAYFINILSLRILARALRGTSREIDSRIYRLFERYLFPLLIVGILFVITDAMFLPPKVTLWIHRLLGLVALIAAISLLTRVSLLVLRNVETHYPGLDNIKGPLELSLKFIFVAVGAMIILDNLGVSVTPLITTLGIGSLAVAIALQDTLGNLFAGLYIKADRPIEVGHFIRLEGGQEGYVEQIGWRSTRVRMLSNNMVIVPNGKVVQSVIINYHLPEPELAVLVDVVVDYNSDLEKVEEISRQVAKEILQTVPGSIPNFEPFIRYHTFGPANIGFTVILRGREFTDNFLIKHEFMKKLHTRYRDEGITFPTQTIHLKTESRTAFQPKAPQGGQAKEETERPLQRKRDE